MNDLEVLALRPGDLLAYYGLYEVVYSGRVASVLFAERSEDHRSPTCGHAIAAVLFDAPHGGKPLDDAITSDEHIRSRGWETHDRNGKRVRGWEKLAEPEGDAPGRGGGVMTAAQTRLAEALVADGFDAAFALKAVLWFSNLPGRDSVEPFPFIRANEHLIRCERDPALAYLKLLDDLRAHEMQFQESGAPTLEQRSFAAALRQAISDAAGELTPEERDRADRLRAELNLWAPTGYGHDAWTRLRTVKGADGWHRETIVAKETSSHPLGSRVRWACATPEGASVWVVTGRKRLPNGATGTAVRSVDDPSLEAVGLDGELVAADSREGVAS